MSIFPRSRTLDSILNTVTTAANTVTSTLDSASHSVGMLNSFVLSASEDQQDRQVLHRDNYRAALLAKSAQAEAVREKAVRKFTSASPENAELYDAAYARMASLFDKRKRA